MKLKLAVAAAVLAAVVAGAAPSPQAREKRLEYKVVLAKVDNVEVRQSVQENGKLKEIVRGPVQSAEAMTKQFNDLVAQGWECVGPVTATDKSNNIHKTSSVFVLFKRDKR